MTTRIPAPSLRKLRAHRNFGALYTAMILLSLHWAVIVYLNSSFLDQFMSKSAISLLYTVSSLATVGIFLVLSHILNRVGNYNLILVLALLELSALVGMAITDSVVPAVAFFMLHNAVMPFILFNLDIFMEEMIGDEEGTTGGRRGLYLGIMSLAGAIAPLASSFLIDGDTTRFEHAYIGSALLMIPFILVIMRFFRTFEDPAYDRVDIFSTIKSYWHRSDIRNVFFAHFSLQLFFAWMVVYSPLYLVTVVGFSWSEVGLVLFAGLMAYVFLEYPIGIIGDKYIGEKEMMALGFVILAVSVSWFAFIGHDVGTWMLAMFMTRVGASFVETTTESYFFKHTKGSDTNIISFFRVTSPLSYVFGALLGSIMIFYLQFNLIFVVLGILMLPGLFFAMALKDTK